MQSLQKAGRVTYKLYSAIGILAMGIMSFGVIATVIMRYFFSISFTFLEEFITWSFAFTTFWAIGMCLLEDEHIIIDFLIIKLKPKTLRILNLINYTVVLVVNIMMVYYSIVWIETAGKVLSKGMKISNSIVYSIMPIGFALATVCTVIKLVLLAKNQEFSLKPKPVEIEIESNLDAEEETAL